jgi:hypothetical protein
MFSAFLPSSLALSSTAYGARNIAISQRDARRGEADGVMHVAPRSAGRSEARRCHRTGIARAGVCQLSPGRPGKKQVPARDGPRHILPLMLLAGLPLVSVESVQSAQRAAQTLSWPSLRHILWTPFNRRS